MDRNYILGVNVRYFRKKRKLTASKLAELMNYSEAWLSNIENHKHKEEIPSEVIRKLAFHLTTTEKILLNEDEYVCSEIKNIELLIAEKRYVEAGENLDSLIEISKDSQGPCIMCQLYKIRGNVEYFQRKYDEAILYYELAFDIAQNSKDWYRMHLLRQNLADSHTEATRYGIAEKYLIDDLQEVEDKKLRATTYLYLGRLYCQQEKWNKAEEALNELLYIQPNLEGKMLISCLQFLCRIYLNQMKYDQLMDTSSRVIELSIESDLTIGKIYGLWMKGEGYLLIENWQEAKKYFESALEMSKEMPVEKVQLEFLIAFCGQDNKESYKKMDQILSVAEGENLHPRILAKMYERASEISYKLNYINDLNGYAKKAIQLLRAVIR